MRARNSLHHKGKTASIWRSRIKRTCCRKRSVNHADPSGMFDCPAKQCAAITKMVNELKNAAKQPETGSLLPSRENQALGKVAGALGKAGDGNGISISNASLSPGTLGQTTAGENGQQNIQLDGKQLAKAGGLRFSAAVLAHEATHAVQNRALGSDISTGHEIYERELQAYRMQSIVTKDLGIHMGTLLNPDEPGYADHLRGSASIERGTAVGVDGGVFPRPADRDIH